MQSQSVFTTAEIKIKVKVTNALPDILEVFADIYAVNFIHCV